MARFFTLKLVPLALLGACSSLQLYAPYPEVTPSEIPGKGGSAAFRVTLDRGQDITVATDIASRPPVINTPSHHKSATVSAEPAIGLGSRGQMGLWVDPIHVGFMLTGKYQLVGQTQTHSEAGNFSLTLLGKAGISSVDSTSGDQKETFGPGGYPYEGSAYLNQGELGFSMGYRPAEMLLAYTGVAVAFYDADIEVEQKEARNKDAASGKYEYDQNGRAENVTVGLQYGKNFGFGVKGSYVRFRWSGVNTLDEIYGSAYIQGHF